MSVKIFISTEIEEHRCRAEFVFKNFSLSTGVQLNFVKSQDDIVPGDLVIVYGNEVPWQVKDRFIQIRRSYKAIEIFSLKRAYLEVYNIASVHFLNLRHPFVPEVIENFKMPVFFQTGEPVFILDEKRCILNFDLISCSFYFLSCWDERILNRRDKFGRFPDEENLIAKLNIREVPIVNLYFYFLKSILERFGLDKSAPFNYNGKTFAICLTHDIDVVRKWSAFGIYNEVVNKFIFGREDIRLRRERFSKFLYYLISGRDPYRDGLRKIINFETSLGVRSTFFFMVGGGSKFDVNYKWDTFILDLIDRLKSSGFEIGLHGSFNSFKDFDMLKMERRRIGELVGLDVIGVRQHFLRFDFKLTPKIQSEAGFRYDSTLGFSNFMGFRCGYSLPFFIYDIDTNREMSIVEIPLIFMDSCYQYGRCDDLDGVIKKLKFILDVTRSFNGILNVLFHNTIYDEFDFDGWGDIFERFIKMALDAGAFIGRCCDIYEIFYRKTKEIA
jgi:hypothetical protein